MTHLTRYLGIDCEEKIASKGSGCQNTKEVVFFSFFAMVFTMLLYCVRRESKNTQDVFFHAFPMDKTRNLFLSALLWLTPVPHWGAIKHFKPGQLFIFVVKLIILV